MKITDTIKARVRNALDSTPQRVAVFFKTGVGEYAEFERFLGITVPTLRKIAKDFKKVPLTVVKELLASPFNEERLLALILLVSQYQAADRTRQESVCQFYVAHLSAVNNWNLVDNSAHLILGAHVWQQDCSLLYELVQSNTMWERRVAIVATWYFIKRHSFECTLTLATKLLQDEHDLIHKATGWMLREVGKQDQAPLVSFLDQYAAVMPRTMLRYALERLSAARRKHYLRLR